MTNDLILILDFGSQYSQLIARRIREMGVYCQIHPYDLSEQQIRALNPKGIILSGGPNSVDQEHAPKAPSVVFHLGVPVLGICYGMQTMAVQLGGKVVSGEKGEFGHTTLKIIPGVCPDFLENLTDQNNIVVWMSHGDHVTEIPPGFQVLANSNVEIAAMADLQRQLFGVQFHPEVTHTPQGQAMLERFVFNICHASATWTPTNIIQQCIEQLRTQLGDDKVILGLSGGVDSSVTAALLHEAIGENLICIFIDNGLLRLNEVEEVRHAFQGRDHLQLHVFDYSKQFLTALQDVTDPEKKRKIIGELFIRAFEEQAKAMGDIKWLAQGTIYSDVIESAHAGKGTSHVIKSHHNVGGLPEKMHLKLVEPLRELFKDEVRKIGLSLGLAPEWVNRHPFPGAGLAVRVMDAVSEPVLDQLRRADAIFMQELHAHDLYHKIGQAFAVFLPVNSVGVVGDARRYAPVIALRAVQSHDFMTATWAEIPHHVLAKIAHRIVNEVPHISRVVYDITSKPPATIEWE